MGKETAVDCGSRGTQSNTSSTNLDEEINPSASPTYYSTAAHVVENIADDYANDTNPTVRLQHSTSDLLTKKSARSSAGDPTGEVDSPYPEICIPLRAPESTVPDLVSKEYQQNADKAAHKAKTQRRKERRRLEKEKNAKRERERADVKATRQMEQQRRQEERVQQRWDEQRWEEQRRGNQDRELQRLVENKLGLEQGDPVTAYSSAVEASQGLQTEKPGAIDLTLARIPHTEAKRPQQIRAITPAAPIISIIPAAGVRARGEAGFCAMEDLALVGNQLPLEKENEVDHRSPYVGLSQVRMTKESEQNTQGVDLSRHHLDTAAKQLQQDEHDDQRTPPPQSAYPNRTNGDVSKWKRLWSNVVDQARAQELQYRAVTEALNRSDAAADQAKAAYERVTARAPHLLAAYQTARDFNLARPWFGDAPVWDSPRVFPLPQLHAYAPTWQDGGHFHDPQTMVTISYGGAHAVPPAAGWGDIPIHIPTVKATWSGSITATNTLVLLSLLHTTPAVAGAPVRTTHRNGTRILDRTRGRERRRVWHLVVPTRLKMWPTRSRSITGFLATWPIRGLVRLIAGSSLLRSDRRTDRPANSGASRN